MTLTWPQINALAAALTAAQPDIDRLSLTSSALAALIGDVTGNPVLSLTDEDANAIKWQWMKLSDAPQEVARTQTGGS